jgi:hypothetical protein
MLELGDIKMPGEFPATSARLLSYRSTGITMLCPISTGRFRFDNFVNASLSMYELKLLAFLELALCFDTCAMVRSPLACAYRVYWCVNRP